MAPHPSTLPWKIPWMEEPDRLQSMGSQRVGHNWATSFSLFTVMHWRREMATHSDVLAWRIPGTGEPGGLLSLESQSQTRLKRLGSSSSSGTLNTGTPKTPWMVWPPGGDVDQQIETTSMHGPLSTVRFGRLVKHRSFLLRRIENEQIDVSLIRCDYRGWGREQII